MNKIIAAGRELARCCPEGGMLFANDKQVLTDLVTEAERLEQEVRRYRNLFGPLAGDGK